MLKINFKTALMASATVLGSLFSSCTSQENEAPPKTVEEKKAKVATEANLLTRMETYSQFKQATDLYTYTAKDDGQFVTIVQDSANMRINLFLDVATGYAYTMEHMSKKGNKEPYHLRDITLKEHHVSDADNPHSFKVHLVHPSASGKDNKRINDTETNLKELSEYRKYGALFTMGNAQTDFNGDKIPQFARIELPDGQHESMVEVGAAAALIDFKKSKNYKLIGVKCEERDLNSSPQFRGYIIKMALDKK